MTADYDRAVCDYMIDLLFIDTELTALIETVSRADHLLIENLAVAPAFRAAVTAAFYWMMRSILRHLLDCQSLELWTKKQFASTSRSIAGAATRSTGKS